MALASLSRRQLLARGSLAAGALMMPRRAWATTRSDEVRFFVIGDWGRHGGAYQRDVARRMERLAPGFGPEFVLSTGDNFYVFGVVSADEPAWESSFERIYSPAALPMPWHVVLGNHDWGGRIWAQLERGRRRTRWNMPWLWYQLRPHRDVAIFMIDTVVWHGMESWVFRVNGTAVPRPWREAQRAWLVDALEQSRDVPMKIVVGHHGIYSVGPHGGRKRNTCLDDILWNAGVTAYVNGHDHCLYHIQADGMDYICSGGGSEELRAYTGGDRQRHCVLRSDCPDPLRPDTPIWYEHQDKAGFASMTASAGSLHVMFHDRLGTVTHDKVIEARRRPSSPRPTASCGRQN